MQDLRQKIGRPFRAGDSRHVVYGIRFTEGSSGVGHWRAVEMVRSSGAWFDTTISRWLIALPVDAEPLLARGDLGEALLSGAIVLEDLPTAVHSEAG